MCVITTGTVHMSQISETTVKASPFPYQKTLPNVCRVSAQAIVIARRLPLLLPEGLHIIVPGGKMQPVNPVLNCKQACTTVMGEKHTGFV